MIFLQFFNICKKYHIILINSSHHAHLFTQNTRIHSKRSKVFILSLVVYIALQLLFNQFNNASIAQFIPKYYLYDDYILIIKQNQSFPNILTHNGYFVKSIVLFSIFSYIHRTHSFFPAI